MSDKSKGDFSPHTKDEDLLEGVAYALFEARYGLGPDFWADEIVRSENSEFETRHPTVEHREADEFISMMKAYEKAMRKKEIAARVTENDDG